MMGTITHNNDAIMISMAYQITSVSAVYSIVCSGADQRKHQSFTSLAFVRGIHRWPLNSPNKGPLTRKMFLFDDVIMRLSCASTENDIFYLYRLTFIPTCNHMPIIRSAIKLLIHSQTSTVLSLKFGKRWVISSYILFFFISILYMV